MIEFEAQPQVAVPRDGWDLPTKPGFYRATNRGGEPFAVELKADGKLYHAVGILLNSERYGPYERLIPVSLSADALEQELSVSQRSDITARVLEIIIASIEFSRNDHHALKTLATKLRGTARLSEKSGS